MADPFVRMERLGKQVVCFLEPGCNVADVAALAQEVREACDACPSIDEMEATLQRVGERHDLRVQRTVSGDAFERLLSFGFLPRSGDRRDLRVAPSTRNGPLSALDVSRGWERTSRRR